MPAWQTDESGDLAFGYFYQLHLLLKSQIYPNETARWTVSDYPASEEETGAECAYADVISWETRKRHDCRLDKSHVSCEVIIPTCVDVFGAAPIAPFVPNQSDGLVSERLAEQLQDSGLKNVELRRVDFPDHIKEDPVFSKIVALIFNGPEVFRLGRNLPDEKNVCPFCGFGPLFCRACKAGFYFCPKCKRHTVVFSESDRKAGDPRILLTRPKIGPIVDPKLWDGSDFCGGSCGTITHRALDWLLSVHAAPFRAEPLYTDVSGLTAEQRKFLETAREPLRRK